jgi:hypothetical protein
MDEEESYWNGPRQEELRLKHFAHAQHRFRVDEY